MLFKRLYSAEAFKWRFKDSLKEYSGAAAALAALASGIFGFGLYVNQMRVYEEKLQKVTEMAAKDALIAKQNAQKDALIAKQNAQKDALIAEERARKDAVIAEERVLIAEEKINAVKMQARKDAEIAQERAEKEALQLLYNIFTQEEYKDAKKRMMAQKDNIANTK